jgi:hypothetical protein
MLDLASARWRELAQAHGSAEDIPRLIDALATVENPDERGDLWYGVWATLCPNGVVQSAAYAAAPHLLAITASQGIAERTAAIHFVVEVECSRHLPGAPRIPDDLVPAYAMAVESLPSIVGGMTEVAWSEQIAQVMAAALLAGKRQPVLARAVLALGGATE